MKSKEQITEIELVDVVLNDCVFKESLKGEQTIKMVEHPTKWENKLTL